MDRRNIISFVKAQAPVNIAVIKYWGKRDETLKIPINDSISGTLSMDDMCTTTSVSLSSDFDSDVFTLNKQMQDLNDAASPAKHMIEEIRAMSENLGCSRYPSSWKIHIDSNNNFPTAAGLASSAAGYACLALALGHTYGITDKSLLSKVARKGSGSACRSLFGGFVHWIKGHDHDTSLAVQIADRNHWPSMRVIICVVNDQKKETSSSRGMAKSVETSTLLQHRANIVVPERVEIIKKAISEKDFESFADVVMKDSNQFHAICLDTDPPIFYLNETSKTIINICSIINEFHGRKKVAYTFDAGPNACIYLLDESVNEFIESIRCLSPVNKPEIKGKTYEVQPIDPSLKEIFSTKLSDSKLDIKYLINTSIGEGPKVITENRSMV